MTTEAKVKIFDRKYIASCPANNLSADAFKKRIAYGERYAANFKLKQYADTLSETRKAELEQLATTTKDDVIVLLPIKNNVVRAHGFQSFWND